MTLPRSSQDWIAGITGDGIVTVCDPRLNKPAARVEDLQQVAELLAVHVLSLTTPGRERDNRLNRQVAVNYKRLKTERESGPIGSCVRVGDYS
jgi:hypothetical protein